MSEQMTIHRGLAELKTLDKRIMSAISSSAFIVANKNSNKQIMGESVDDYKKTMQGNYDSVEGLIKRRDIIKRAIIKSNAITVVKIGVDEITVAEAIDVKNNIIYKKTFAEQLEKQFLQSNAKVVKENDSLPQKLEQYLASILGNKDKADPEDVKSHTEMFNKNNEYSLIDPNQLVKKIEIMKVEISDFETNVDAVLSESNALTMIEI